MTVNKVTAIIVIYNPIYNELINSLSAILPQVSKVVLVDNTPVYDKKQEINYLNLNQNKIEIITLNENYGIAYAQNIGIEWAINNNAEYVLFIDQDSVADVGMVDKLLLLYNKQDLGINIKNAAVGPLHIDSRNGIESYFLTKNHSFYSIINFQNKIKRVKQPVVEFLISSGMLVSKEMLNKIRGKRSEYFIDHVDTEWCLRARKAGYQLSGVDDALLFHTLGENVRRVWLFSFRNVHLHNPIRNYYSFRNTILLFKDTNLTAAEYIFQIIRLIQLFLFYMIFENMKKQRFQMIMLGLFHGIKRISGKLNPETGKCQKIPVTKYDPLP